MKYEQATQIIQHHLEWLRSDKSIEYKYTEKAFNEALKVVLKNTKSFEDALLKIEKYSRLPSGETINQRFTRLKTIANKPITLSK